MKRSSPVVTPAIIGLDVGDRITHLCALDQDREVVERTRFATTPDAVRKLFKDPAPVSIVLEAGSQSPWLSAELHGLGHRVQVADPRRIALIAKGHRKTDRRDAEVPARLALPWACPSCWAECITAALRAMLVWPCCARDLCVRIRTKCVLHVPGTLKMFGCACGCARRQDSTARPGRL